MRNYQLYAKTTQAQLRAMVKLNKTEILTLMTIRINSWHCKKTNRQLSTLSHHEISTASGLPFSSINKATTSLQKKGFVLVVARGHCRSNTYQILENEDPKEPEKTKKPIVDNYRQIVDNYPQIVDNSRNTVDNFVDNFSMVSKSGNSGIAGFGGGEFPDPAIPINKLDINKILILDINHHSANFDYDDDGIKMKRSNEILWRSIHEHWANDQVTQWSSKSDPVLVLRRFRRLLGWDQDYAEPFVRDVLEEINMWMWQQRRTATQNKEVHIWQGNDWIGGLMRWMTNEESYQVEEPPPITIDFTQEPLFGFIGYDGVGIDQK
tara:strand:- start:2724 stop:3689 length:966 start_codon:yes stop_codon:yes gene_type:complete